MDKKFTILGAGSSSSIKLNNNNALVETFEGKLLIDCGYTIKKALFENQLSINDIDGIFITHVHADHVFGLERFAIETRYKYKNKKKLIYPKALREELWDQTLKGSLGTNSEGIAHIGDYFEVIELDELNFNIFGLECEVFQVPHTPMKPSYGIVINEKILYTGDCLPITEKIKEIVFTIGFHDSSITTKNPVHAHYKDLIREYSYELRKKLYLMSYEDDWEMFKPEIEKEFIGVAKEGMTFCF